MDWPSSSESYPLKIATRHKKESIEQFSAKLMEVISQVMVQYHKLYSVRQNLEVKRTSLKLAETILDNTQDRVKAGVLPSMEILNAKFGLASQKKNLIDAERALKDQIGVLRVLLQLDGVSDIIPIDELLRYQYRVDESLDIQRALSERPDLKQLRISLKSVELQSRVARNQTLPELNAVASIALDGLAGSYGRDLERLGTGQNPNWIVGLQFSYPLGNDSAKNEYIKSKIRVEQTRTQVRRLEEIISNDVSTAVRAVESGFLQLDVTAQGRAYAEEVLQAYVDKQKAGLATTKDVLDVLNNLVVAQGNDIQAVTEYNNAIVALWKTTGELLEREGVTLGEKEANSIYENNR